ncbi:MAG: TonB-dependent receptor plug domain-containing protein [Campylobacterota bacterium]
MNKKLTTSLVASLLLATNLTANETLDTITVTSATKSEQSIKDVTSNVEVITSQEIEERHFTTVSEALNTLSGINVINNGGLGKSTSVFTRGFDSQRLLVLIDGINFNDFTGIGGARFEHLIISDIERIEVVKGAQSGIWGADANAGVINIITKSSQKGTNANIQVEYGSYNTKKLITSLSHKTDRYDVRLGISRIDSDGFSARVPRGGDIDDFEKDGYENTTINFKSGVNLNENNRVELAHNIINSKSQYDGGFGAIPSIANSRGYELETKNDYTSFQYTNNNSFSDIKAYVNYSRVNRDDPLGYTKKFDGNRREYGLNTTIPYFNEKSFITIGTDYKITNHKNSVNKELNNKAIFATNSTNFGNTVFTQSLRYDKYDLFNNKTTGKIGVRHNFSEDLYATVNYGTSYNVPSFYKLYNPSAGFADLQPETTKSSDVTLGYKGFNLTYFHNKIINMIEYNTATYKYFNMDGVVTLQGLEAGYKGSITDDLLVGLNYTFTSAKDDNDKRLQRRVKDSIKFAFDYYGIEKLHLNLNGEYVGDRFQYTFGTYNKNANTGNYTLWNAVVNYDVNNTLKIYLKLDNITNKKYQNIDTYGAAERSAYVGLNYKF